MTTAFTITQVIYNFTATTNYPVTLTLTDSPDQVNVHLTSSSFFVSNNLQPVTVSTGGAGVANPFNQSLNTTNNVQFDTISTNEIYGVGQNPVSFPNGINIGPNGLSITSSQVNFGVVNSTITNQLDLIWAFLPADFGSILNPSHVAIQF